MAATSKLLSAFTPSTPTLSEKVLKSSFIVVIPADQAATVSSMPFGRPDSLSSSTRRNSAARLTAPNCCSACPSDKATAVLSAAFLALSSSVANRLCMSFALSAADA